MIDIKGLYALIPEDYQFLAIFSLLLFGIIITAKLIGATIEFIFKMVILILFIYLVLLYLFPQTIPSIFI